MKTPDLVVLSQNFIVDNLILCSDDFFNSNSEILAKKFSLSIPDIVQNYLEISYKKSRGDFRTVAWNDDPINFYDLLAKKFVSSAIIHYELIEREEISFVFEEKGFFFYDLFGPAFQMKMAKRNEMYADVLRKEQLNYYNLII